VKEFLSSDNEDASVTKKVIYAGIAFIFSMFFIYISLTTFGGKGSFGSEDLVNGGKNINPFTFFIALVASTGIAIYTFKSYYNKSDGRSFYIVALWFDDEKETLTVKTRTTKGHTYTKTHSYSNLAVEYRIIIEQQRTTDSDGSTHYREVPIRCITFHEHDYSLGSAKEGDRWPADTFDELWEFPKPFRTIVL